MKVKDLHIGDILLVAISPMRIDSIDERTETIRGKYLDDGEDTLFFKANHADPMPIDKAFLELNFGLCGKAFAHQNAVVKPIGDGIVSITIQDNDGNVVVNTVVRYVHELQRAMRLGGLSDKVDVLRVQ